MKKTLKTIGSELVVVLRNPVLKPVEIWALRAIFVAVAAWLGIDATKI